MIIGLNINTLKATRMREVKGKIRISNKTDIKSVKEVTLPSKEKVCNIEFEFQTEYAEGGKRVAIVQVEGIVLYKGANKNILGSWKKDKKLPKEVILPVMNHILHVCSIKAITLSEQVNLPPPIPLLRVRKKEPEVTYIG